MWGILKTKVKWSKENSMDVRKIFQIGYHTRHWGLPFGYSYTGNIHGVDYNIYIYLFFLYFNWTKCTFTSDDGPSTNLPG